MAVDWGPVGGIQLEVEYRNLELAAAVRRLEFPGVLGDIGARRQDSPERLE